MRGKIERLFTKTGFVYKTDFSEAYVKANYTMGFLLRKIYVYNNNKKYFALKQKDIKLKVFYNIFWLLNITEKPVCYLYQNDEIIGETGKYSSNSISLNIHNYRIDMVYQINKESHKVNICRNNLILAEITKSKLRFDKKTSMKYYMIIGNMI